MSPAELRQTARAIELRRRFDRSFAEPRHVESVSTADLLAVRLGSDSYAVRLSEIAGIFADKRVARLPSQLTALVGVAGFRGAVLPVWDLSTLLGYPPSGASRWLVISAKEPLALMLGEFEGYLRVAREAIAPGGAGVPGSPDSNNALRQHVREIVRGPGGVRPIVDVSSVVDSIKRQFPEDALHKER